MDCCGRKPVVPVCEKAGEHVKRRSPLFRLLWAGPVVGLASLIWFMVRVGPKPSRATYPCQKVAMPLASGFVVWLVGTIGSIIAFRRARLFLRQSRKVVACVCLMAAAILAIVGLYTMPERPAVADNPIPNSPIGVAKGLNPGRVVWVHNPSATNWQGPGDGHWWESTHTIQSQVDAMMSQALRGLSGAATDTAAWDAFFRNFNSTHGKGDIGYQPGEKIAVKINLVGCIDSGGWGGVDPATYDLVSKMDYMNASPQMMLALLRQLINVAGVNQADISIGDPVCLFPNQYYNPLHDEFPNVHYLDHLGYFGRTQPQPSNVNFYFSARPTGVTQDKVLAPYAEAAYFINLANFKSHSAAGVTLCGKNYYGFLRTPPEAGYYSLHDSLPTYVTGMGHYRCIVDLMGSAQTGGKALLYLIDGLYSGVHPDDGAPRKWSLAPFNGDWTSSLFASQDPVAIDSVGFDFLWQEGDPRLYPHMSGAEDYLHEAAQANNPPSGTFYDSDHATATVRMASLGVHEHWNNATDKQYSRNLGTGNGIELIHYGPAPAAPVVFNTTTFDSGAQGWTTGVWHSGGYADGTMAWSGTVGNPGGGMSSAGSGATDTNDRGLREGGSISKTISTAGYNGISVSYDVRASIQGGVYTGTGTGTGSVRNNDVQEQLNLYYSTNGGSTWNQAATLWRSDLLGCTTYQTKTVPLVGISACNDNPNFALKFEWQFNQQTDTGYLDNIALSSVPANPAPTGALNVKRATSIKIDGKPEDWNLAEFTTPARGGQIEAGDYALIGYSGGTCYSGGHYTNGQYPPTNRADHTARVWSRHDDVYQCFLVRVDDSDLQTGNPLSSNWANDCVEFYIDPVNAGGASPLSNSTSAIQLVIDAANQKNLYMCTSGYASTVLAGVTSAVTTGSYEGYAGWWLEARILKTALNPAMPVNGTFSVDFNFRDNDNNNDPAQTTVYDWNDPTTGAGVPSKIPDNWADAVNGDPAAPSMILNVKPATSALTIDGSASDWNLSEFTTFIYGGTSGSGDKAFVGYDARTGLIYRGGWCSAEAFVMPTSAADHSATIYSQHDTTYQYFLVRIEDDDIQFPNPVDTNWANDCAEFFLDPGHFGGSVSMTTQGSTASASNVELVIDANNQKNVYMCTSAYRTQVLNGVTSAVVRDATGWTAEVRIQKAALDPDMPASGTFGVDFLFRDNDNGHDPTKTSVYAWRDPFHLGTTSMCPTKIPNNWGDVVNPVWAPPDSDGDGVSDSIDQCPNTVPHATVDAVGCPPAIRFDFDRDGDVDLTPDYGTFELCFTGPGVFGPPAGCSPEQFGRADADGDNDVDQVDFSLFQRCYSGQNNPANLSCAD
jgi:hypothetical protein